MLKIAICSGGTGGHMFPACALFESLKEKGHKVNIITDTRGDRFCSDIISTEKTVISTIRFNFSNIFNSTLKTISAVYDLLKLWKGKDKRPNIVIGFGGSFTLIPIFIAKILNIKIIIYEQNSIIGRANKLLAHIADYKVSTFVIDEAWKQIPSPVRKEFIKAVNINSEYKCEDKIKIVVIGGSQGAVSFSCIIPRAISMIDKNLRSNIDIVQQVSSAKIEDLQKEYKKLNINARLFNFVNNVAEEMSKAQLIICRSGASTLAELSTLGRPAILIPYPLAADNHQFYNAMCYKNKQAAWVVEEDENIEKTLSEIITNLLKNRQLLKKAASNMINTLGTKSNDIFVDFIEKSVTNSKN